MFQSNVTGSVHPSQLVVCFHRQHKDLIINFRIDMESDGATSGLNKGCKLSMKLDKLISASNALLAAYSNIVISCVSYESIAIANVLLYCYCARTRSM